MTHWKINENNLILRYLSWLLGLLVLSLIVALVYFSEVASFAHFFTLPVLIPWFFVTLLARILMVEVFVRPIHALDYPLNRMAGFWLGWLRTFSNYIVPFSGVTLIAAYCKRKCGLDWGQIAALSSPLFLLSFATAGTFATIAILVNCNDIGMYTVPMAGITTVITGISILLIAKGTSGLIFVPIGVRRKLESMELTLKKFAGHKRLLSQLSLCYSGIIVLRCFRLWVLFALGTSLSLSIQELLLLAAISEFGFLVPLIPGGVGIREGAMVGAAWLLGLNLEIVALVALMDRLFSIAAVALMAMPAYLVLSRKVGSVSTSN